jgi:hypothetical protein
MACLHMLLQEERGGVLTIRRHAIRRHLGRYAAMVLKARDWGVHTLAAWEKVVKSCNSVRANRERAAARGLATACRGNGGRGAAH